MYKVLILQSREPARTVGGRRRAFLDVGLSDIEAAVKNAGPRVAVPSRVARASASQRTAAKFISLRRGARRASFGRIRIMF
jgi:hypothetical protein